MSSVYILKLGDKKYPLWTLLLSVRLLKGYIELIFHHLFHETTVL